jgi:hypothetical protein
MKHRLTAISRYVNVGLFYLRQVYIGMYVDFCGPMSYRALLTIY